MNEIEVVAGVFSDEKSFKLAMRAGLDETEFQTPFPKICIRAGRYFFDNGIEASHLNLQKYIEDVSESVVSVKRKSAMIKRVSRLSSEVVEGFDYDFHHFLKKRKELQFRRAMNIALMKMDEDPVVGRALMGEALRLDQEIAEFEKIIDIFSKEGAEDIHARRLDMLDGSGRTLKFHGNMAFLKKYYPRGVPKSTNIAITAPTGVGKSIMLANIISQAVSPVNQLNVLYIVTENRIVEAGTRLQAIHTNLEHDRFYDTDFSYDSMPLVEEIEGTGRVFMWKVPIRTLSAFQIEQALEYIDNQHGLMIDAVVIDSPEHMVPNVDSGDYYRDQASVVYDLKQLGDEQNKNLMIFMTYQLTAETVKTNMTFAEGMAGSKERGRTLDGVMQMYTEEGDKLLSMRRLKITKLRDGAIDGAEIQLMVHSTLRITLFSQEDVSGVIDDIFEEIRRRESGEPPPKPDDPLPEPLETSGYNDSYKPYIPDPEPDLEPVATGRIRSFSDIINNPRNI